MTLRNIAAGASLAIAAATMIVLTPASAQDAPASAQDADAAPTRDTTPPPSAQKNDDDRFNQDEVVQAGSDFFGTTTETMAKAVERVFSDLGEPDGYIKGDEGSGAVILGVRYGSGWLVRKGHEPVQVFWKGPSIGFDLGANGSKSFTLVYNLKDEDRLFQRFPGVEGSYYFIAGIGVNYLRSDGVTLAPMRTGLGLRAGVNVHYQVYSKERDWFPL